ncbi:MAG: dTDP-4-dehydrorhamnose reductase [Candidatus Magnetomorum sp.]|nr:dTDP-4-dehydrorhamnose reductase [Candidatus Magnetomorum sp.]
MPPKIIITGAFGQLGSDCMQLLSDHYIIIACSHSMLDIGKPKKSQKTLADFRPDIIINCAAYTQVDDCEIREEHAYQINAKGPGYLARYAHLSGAKLIHISTDYVFDGSLPVPNGYEETDTPNPVSVYGKSKYAGEQAIISETDRFVILRTAWLFGINGHNFLKTIFRLAISEKQPPLKVINTQYGSFTHTLDLARQIHRLIVADAQGIYHASGEGYCTWYDGARHFLNAMGIQKDIQPCTEQEFPTKAIRPKNSILNNCRLKKENIHIMPNWQDGINAFVTLFKKEAGDVTAYQTLI